MEDRRTDTIFQDPFALHKSKERQIFSNNFFFVGCPNKVTLQKHTKNKTTKDLAPNYAQFSQAPHQGISKATFLLFKCEKCCRERFTSADQLIKLVWFIEQKSKENIEWQHLPVNQMYIKVAIKFQRF